MLNILLSIVTNRILWGFMGVTALSAVVWMIGPLLSIVDSRPLESETNRIISIALIYLIWVHSHIVPRLYNAWLNRKLMDKLNEGKPAEEGGSDVKRLGNDDKVLADRFDEAAQILKKRTSTRRASAASGRSVSARSISISFRGM